MASAVRLCALMAAACSCAAAAPGPRVVNGSFEADRFGKSPGYAAGNGGKITGWQFRGHVGVNPWWQEPAKPAGPVHSFSDNGRIPHGRQAALIQNVGELRQRIEGFQGGKRYQVTFCENARRYNFKPEAPPRLKVTLGRETIVSLHPVIALDGRDQRRLPYARVESAIFVAPAHGAYDLVFSTTVGTRVTVLIDKVAIRQVR